ncbi:hypothetical protein LOZ51_000668 [Ophidiomyces ophidiicola]|nr:hypothetical protein LOZ54_006095 [Ophidiomyces ophidiicola]KAI1982478.1 hypothetical protein LOZ55_000260 [Ophidiomyces ophidiicola]KAI2003586.1 hypothetical protein LOZ51_000668 [Ophidiomyces ophidiicola]
MSGLNDPATGQPLPADAIQRVLYVCHPVHVYAIPPLMSMKGYTAADWTVPDPQNEGKTKEIFAARLRILETAFPIPAPRFRVRPGSPLSASPSEDSQEKVKTDILLEDSNTGDLFAAAPYTDASVVEHTIDSSRFFALRVVGDGRKAVLGIGFEDRSEAFDFGVALQEARKVLGFPAAGDDNKNATARLQRPALLPPSGAGRRLGMTPMRGRMGKSSPRASQQAVPQEPSEKPDNKPKDYSLKPGQTITVNIGNRANIDTGSPSASATEQEDQKALFSIPPPPGVSSLGGTSGDNTIPFLPPPPSSKDSRVDRRRRPPSTQGVGPSGFAEQKAGSTVTVPHEDDDFGEFQ